MTAVKVCIVIDEGGKRGFYRWPAPWLVDVLLVGDTTYFGLDYGIYHQPDKGAFGCAILESTLGFKPCF